METILFIIALLFLLSLQIGSIRVNKARFESLKGRITKVDDHLHDLVYDLDKKDSKGMLMISALLGKTLYDHTDSDNQFIVEDKKTGKKLIGNLFESPIVLRPLTEVKAKEGVVSIGTFQDGKQYEYAVEVPKSKDTLVVSPIKKVAFRRK